MRRFQPSIALCAVLFVTGLLLLVSLSHASKPLSGGVSTTEVIRQLPPPTAVVQPVVRGFVGLDLSIMTQQPPLVKSVFPNSPAAQGGIQAGDRLLAADNQSLIGLNKQATDDAISDQIGHIILFQVQRGGQVFSAKVRVGPQPRSF